MVIQGIWVHCTTGAGTHHLVPLAANSPRTPQPMTRNLPSAKLFFMPYRCSIPWLLLPVIQWSGGGCEAAYPCFSVSSAQVGWMRTLHGLLKLTWKGEGDIDQLLDFILVFSRAENIEIVWFPVGILRIAVWCTPLTMTNGPIPLARHTPGSP